MSKTNIRKRKVKISLWKIHNFFSTSLCERGWSIKWNEWLLSLGLNRRTKPKGKENKKGRLQFQNKLNQNVWKIKSPFFSILIFFVFYLLPSFDPLRDPKQKKNYSTVPPCVCLLVEEKKQKKDEGRKNLNFKRKKNVSDWISIQRNTIPDPDRSTVVRLASFCTNSSQGKLMQNTNLFMYGRLQYEHNYVMMIISLFRLEIIQEQKKRIFFFMFSRNFPNIHSTRIKFLLKTFF